MMDRRSALLQRPRATYMGHLLVLTADLTIPLIRRVGCQARFTEGDQ
jgi:hypothetical protein